MLHFGKRNIRERFSSADKVINDFYRKNDSFKIIWYYVYDLFIQN